MRRPERLADPSQAFRLDGKVAVVTGASSGIGVALAEGPAAAGARVALAARRRDRLEGLAERRRALGAESFAVSCDVARPEQVEQLARDVTAQLGPVDVLVDNAGIGSVVAAEHEPLDGSSFRAERPLRGLRSRTPMGRPGRRDELVGPALFLASDAASYVTGQTLLVDGGWIAV